MKTLHRSTRRALALLGAIASCTAPGLDAAELWVVNRNGSVSIVDTDTNTAGLPFNLPDKDGDLSPDPAHAVAFSTIPGQETNHAFVTARDNWLFVLETTGAGGPNVIQEWDIGEQLQLTDVLLRGLAAAPSSEFQPPMQLPAIRSFLHVAVTRNDPAGGRDARFAVLDQDCLIQGNCDPVVDQDVLLTSSTATAVDVTVLGLPFGTLQQRAWYSVTDGDPGELSAYLVAGTRDTDFAVRESQTFVLDSADAVPDVLQISAPLDREFPVFPQAGLGKLVNLDQGGECDLGGEQVAATVTGVGRGSYTVFSLDQSTEQLRVLNPATCTELTPISVGSQPRHLVAMDRERWTSIFVSNCGSDTVTRIVNPADMPGIPIDLCPLGGCNLCPTNMAMNHKFCVITDLEPCPKKLGEDACCLEGDTCEPGADFLDWPDCPFVTSYDVWCACIDEDWDNPFCGCYCNCDLPPAQRDEDCLCPLPQEMQDSPGPDTNGFTLILPSDTGPKQGPWKKLGNTPVSSFTDTQSGNFSVDYQATREGVTPDPPDD